MNQLFPIALGGAAGAVLRYLVSSGVYGWLGRDFPYGTLSVNVIGSFLMGLMTTALLLERVALAEAFSLALLVGCFGSFTTFSTFSLDTLSLLEQGNIVKAAANVLGNVVACVIAVWMGLKIGKILHGYQGGIIEFSGISFPYAFAFVILIVSVLIGCIAYLIMQHNQMHIETQVTALLIMLGLFITLSSVYLAMYLLEMDISPNRQLSTMLGVLLGNTALSALGVLFGLQCARWLQ